jgi:hypothetical protein
MLFLFLIHSLSTRAAPISIIEYSNISPSCKDIDHCRTLFSLTWSCITTIFLCTWVMVCPNISGPAESAPNTRQPRFIMSKKFWSSLGNTTLLFMCALVFPEFILAWAARQYIVAGKIVKENRTLSYLSFGLQPEPCNCSPSRIDTDTRILHDHGRISLLHRLC